MRGPQSHTLWLRGPQCKKTVTFPDFFGKIRLWSEPKTGAGREPDSRPFSPLASSALNAEIPSVPLRSGVFHHIQSLGVECLFPASSTKSDAAKTARYMTIPYSFERTPLHDSCHLHARTNEKTTHVLLEMTPLKRALYLKIHYAQKFCIFLEFHRPLRLNSIYRQLSGYVLRNCSRSFRYDVTCQA